MLPYLILQCDICYRLDQSKAINIKISENAFAFCVSILVLLYLSWKWFLKLVTNSDLL
jgi:hypothetical protein